MAHLDRAVAALGDREVVVYEGVLPHVPEAQVSEAVDWPPGIQSMR